MFKRWKLDQEYRELCAERYADAAHISEAASMLVLGQSGVILSEEAIFAMADRLSDFAKEHGLEPEDIQPALAWNEPQLGPSTLDI